MMGRVTARVQNTKFFRSRAGQMAFAASAGLHAGLFVAVSASILSSLGAVALVPMLYLLGRFIHRGLRSTPSAGPIHNLIEFERRDLIERANSALKSEAGSSNLELGEFFLRAEILGKPGKEKERYEQIGKELLNFDKGPGRKLEEISIKAKNALRNESGDPTQRFQKLFDLLYPGFLRNYKGGQGNLYGQLVEGKGNCEALSKLLISLSPVDGKEWEPACALYHQHLEIVLFNRTTGEVYDPIERKILNDSPTAIFHRNLFFFAYLQGIGIEPPIQVNELLLKDKPENINAPEDKEGLISNSIFIFDVDMVLPNCERGQESSSPSYYGEPSEAPPKEPFSLKRFLTTRYGSAGGDYYWAKGALMGVLTAGTITAISYLCYIMGNAIYQTYKEYILCKMACEYASLKSGGPVPYTFFRNFDQVDFTRCEPSFWDSRLSYEERLKPVIDEMTRKLEAGHANANKVEKKLETSDPKGLVEFEGAIAKARNIWKIFGYQLAINTFDRVIRDKRFTISAEFENNSGWIIGGPGFDRPDFAWDLLPYSQLINTRERSLPKLFGSIEGALNLYKLPQPELVQVVKSLSFQELVRAVIYLENVPYGPALVAEGRPDGIRDSKNRDGRDRANIKGDKGRDDRSKRGTAFTDEVLTVKKPGGIVLKGKEDGKDIKDQPGNHSSGNSEIPEREGYSIERSSGVLEVDIVSLDTMKELKKARISPREILRKQTRNAPKLSSVPWDFLVRFMDAVRAVYPEEADSLTWRIKARLSQNPEARNRLRRLGEDVNDYEKKVHEGGFLK